MKVGEMTPDWIITSERCTYEDGTAERYYVIRKRIGSLLFGESIAECSNINAAYDIVGALELQAKTELEALEKAVE